MKFVKKTTYYSVKPVYEFNLPAGHACPYADACRVCVNEKTGKFVTTGSQFRCYAASSERFPAVRKMRWQNYRDILANTPIILPKGAAYVRIHASGDFFSQRYFDQWLEVCSTFPWVRFWAFTKSIQYWVNRLNQIPKNLRLQASYGSMQDHLIKEYDLKYAKVFKTRKEVADSGLPLDTDDSYAMMGTQSFALLDNFSRE